MSRELHTDTVAHGGHVYTITAPFRGGRELIRCHGLHDGQLEEQWLSFKPIGWWAANSQAVFDGTARL